MGLFTRSSLSDEFGIPADSEGIGLEHALDRAYQRAFFSTGDGSFAEEHAIEVTTMLARKWLKDRGQPSPDDEPAGYFVQPNRAFQIDLTSFSKLNEYKREWLSDYRSRRRMIDRETLAVWFTDHIVNYGLKRHSSYAAIGILKVLFNYKYEDVDEVLQRIDDRRWGSARNKQDDLRRWKKKLFADLKNWFGTDLLKIEESDRGEDLFTEHRFIKQAVTDQKVESVFAALRFLTPLKPECALAQKSNIKSNELEALLKAHALSSSAHAVERERIHVMDHPDDLFYIVNELGSNREVKAPDEYLEIPEFGLSGWDGDGPPPVDRQNLPPLGDQQRRKIEREVLKRKKRINKLALESVVIAVDDEERIRLPLDRPQTVQLRLDEGDCLVEVRGRDRKGSLPLDALFISWNGELVGNQPQTYRVELGQGHEINLLVSYERDAFGDLSGASMEIEYQQLPQPATARPLTAVKRGPWGSAPLSEWLPQFLLILLAIGLIARLPLYWYSQRSSDSGIKSAKKSGGRLPQVAELLPSPSPAVPKASPTPGEVQPPKRKKPSANAASRKGPSKFEDNNLVAVNYLRLDKYSPPSEPDPNTRGEGRPRKSARPYLTIYASRTQLTSVRIKLGEGGLTGQHVVDLENGFFRPLAPGKIKSFKDGLLTVDFDLRSLPFQRYFLALTHEDDVPKHYLVHLIDSRTLLRRERQRSVLRRPSSRPGLISHVELL